MKKFTIPDIYKKIEENEKVSFLTAYDFPTSYFAKQAEIEMLLIGDSGGMCLLGKKNTLEVTMEEMLIMTEAVVKGNDISLIVADMPFLSYQVNNDEAVKNAGSFMQRNADAVKLEGGERVAGRVKAIVDAGIPVMGHLGLTPQNMSQLGGYKVQGKTIDSVKSLVSDVESLIDSGVFSILLEAIPNEISEMLLNKFNIPFFGIGAGRNVNGQLVISNDILGNFVGDINPKFVKKYANIQEVAVEAFKDYKKEIKNLEFPTEEHFYEINPKDLKEIKKYFSI